MVMVEGRNPSTYRRRLLRAGSEQDIIIGARRNPSTYRRRLLQEAIANFDANNIVAIQVHTGGDSYCQMVR